MFRSATIALLLGTLLAGGHAAPAHAGDSDLGRLWASDKVLRSGCHDYRYQYKVTAPTRDWMLETFLRDPSGEIIASNTLDSRYSHNPKRGSGTFRFCRYATSPGRFKIRGKLTRFNGLVQRTGWVKPGYFRMRLAS